MEIKVSMLAALDITNVSFFAAIADETGCRVPMPFEPQDNVYRHGIGEGETFVGGLRGGCGQVG
ncbi:hypothetical protein [Mesorhizobium sp.]|uniref:hypothetical protein n=1 Tax=Mesorhizobium sp. TaxID=1871066 RepID=UPI000FE37B13|nr:hypothetical protein [Mesorhizobium sp.]RWO01696.1 MAG: hypothetical protein EOS06_05545 [Mesorhizobium sp.]